jgi:formylglycine-generating enzyme required for sulfatase activity
VSLGDFVRFRPAHPVNRVYSATDDSPANQLSWYDAVAYCNWLSEQEGIPSSQWCYLPDGAGEYGPGMAIPPDHLQRTGYRLPTQAEWEYACRAGSTTARFFGESDELLEHYAWCTRNSEDRRLSPSATFKPNDLGLFDVYGNVLEWCTEQADGVPDGDGPIDDRVETEAVVDEIERAARGGSFVYRLVDIRSAFRFRYRPTNRNNFIGFRVARTLPAGVRR